MLAYHTRIWDKKNSTFYQINCQMHVSNEVIVENVFGESCLSETKEKRYRTWLLRTMMLWMKIALSEVYNSDFILRDERRKCMCDILGCTLLGMPGRMSRIVIVQQKK